jgi:tRNA-specific 2-thiouridylase
VKIAVMLSGGIDSFVTALLLKKEGHEVSALTMVNWDYAIVDKACWAAETLGIHLTIIELQDYFSRSIVNSFCESYLSGKTPNPCVKCNKKIKFGYLLSWALENGYDKVATGHYAIIEYHKAKDRYLLKKGRDYSKDQSYFLYALDQEQLSRTCFPLGEMTKQEVMEMAFDNGFPRAYKESQEICFINGDYRDLLRKRSTLIPGNIVDMSGKIIGRHQGLPLYTVGQRKGLGVSAGYPVYVIDMDMENNQLVVDKEEYLYTKELYSINNNLIYYATLDSDVKVEAKIRYRAQPAVATISWQKDNSIKAVFAEPQRAVTRGQSAVYYIGEYVLGGGEIW